MKPHENRSYEQLMGGLERVVAYRGRRYLVSEFLARRSIEVVVQGETYSLYDLSMNGLSFFAPLQVDHWEKGQQWPTRVLLDGRPVFDGTGRVVRTEASPRRRRVAMVLLDGIIDLPGILWDIQELQLNDDLKLGPRPVRELVPEAYRAAMERAVHFVQFYRKTLGEHEERYVQHRGDAGHESTVELAARAVEGIRGPWREIYREAADAARPFLRNRQVFTAAKRYTETLLTPLLRGAPIIDRSYSKPLGYAGDFHTMLHIYRDTLEGRTAFDKVFHKLTCEEPLAVGVRTRMALVLEHHIEAYEAFVRARAGDASEPFRVLSLGSGPCRELAEFLASRTDWPVPVHWTVLDQEEQALSYAHEQVGRRIELAGAPHKLHCWNTSYIQLVKDPSLPLVTAPQHLVYASGLFDYLHDLGARVLARVLYDQLAPGGQMLVGNALGPNDHFWLAEFVLDWNLIYRTEQEMLDLLAEVERPGEAEVLTETSGAYYFLKVRKPVKSSDGA